MHIGVFWCPQKGFVSKVHWWCLKNTIFCRFLRFFAPAFKAFCFLCWPFLLLVLFLFAFFFTCCCCCCLINQVAMFWFLFLLFWVSLVLCVISWCFLVCFCFWGFKGQVRWPKGPPPLALNSPYLFSFVFGLFFVFFVGFRFFFCICFWFFWKGLRVRWGYPKGHLTWP